jgi:hypothetical protein
MVSVLLASETAHKDIISETDVGQAEPLSMKMRDLSIAP